jgi:hypothetical protein
MSFQKNKPTSHCGIAKKIVLGSQNSRNTKYANSPEYRSRISGRKIWTPTIIEESNLIHLLSHMLLIYLLHTNYLVYSLF